MQASGRIYPEHEGRAPDKYFGAHILDNCFLPSPSHFVGQLQAWVRGCTVPGAPHRRFVPFATTRAPVRG